MRTFDRLFPWLLCPLVMPGIALNLHDGSRLIGLVLIFMLGAALSNRLTEHDKRKRR